MSAQTWQIAYSPAAASTSEDDLLSTRARSSLRLTPISAVPISSASFAAVSLSKTLSRVRGLRDFVTTVSVSFDISIILLAAALPLVEM